MWITYRTLLPGCRFARPGYGSYFTSEIERRDIVDILDVEERFQ
jgi:hypothetical protein